MAQKFSGWTVAQMLPDYLPAPIETGRGGYTLTMRECRGAEEVLNSLSRSAPDPGIDRIHVGWGSFRNLDIAASRASEWVLLLDVNVHQFRVWEAVRSALNQSHVRGAAEFVDAVLPLLPDVPRLRQFSDSTRTWLMGDLEREGSWLSPLHPQRFECVRSLFIRNRVALGCLDLRAGPGPEGHAFAEIRRRMQRALENETVTFDTLYISNIPWMLAQPVGFFGEQHHAHMVDASEPVLQRVHHNLSVVAPLFNAVVSAARLREDATAGNLQWQTEVLSPSRFLAPQYWDSLQVPLPG